MHAKNAPDTLTLTQVMIEVGWPDRSSLVRLLDVDETRTMLGVMPGPWPAYPREALPAFQALCAAYQAGRVKPKTAPKFLQEFISGVCEHPIAGVSEQPNVAIIGNPNTALIEQPDIAVIEQPNTGATEIPNIGREMCEVMREFIRAVRDITPMCEDSTLTRHQAAALLSCVPSSVGRYVRPLRRGVYRRSDVMRYIATGVARARP